MHGAATASIACRAWWPWRDRAAELDAEIAFHLAEEADARRADGLAGRRGPRRGAPRLRQRRHGPRGHARGVGLGADRAARPGRPLRPAGADRRADRLDRRHPDPDAGDRRQHRHLLDRQRPAAPAAAGRRAGAPGAALGAAARRRQRAQPLVQPDLGAAARSRHVRRRLRLGRPALQPGAVRRERPGRPGCGRAARMFEVLGVQAVVGRTLTAEDDRRSAGPDGPVAVHRLRLLAAALRRIAGRHRPPHHGRTRAVHHRRRRAAVVLRRRGRTHVRRGDPDRGVDAHPRRRFPRSPHVVVAARDVPPEARADAGRGERRNSRALAPAIRQATQPDGVAARPLPARGARGRRRADRARRRCAASTSGR